MPAKTAPFQTVTARRCAAAVAAGNNPLVHLHGFTLDDLAPFKLEKAFAPGDSADFRVLYVGRDDVHGALKYILMRSGVSLIDFATGQWAAIGILAALLEREQTGNGRTIDTSLYETSLALLASQLASYAATGDAPGRHGSAFPLIAPYEVFPTSDGSLMIVAGSDGLFERLRGAVGLPDDERFRTNPDRVRNRAALADLLSERLRTRTSAEWESELTAAGVPVSPLRDVGEAFEHEQTRALGILQQLGDGTTVSPPFSVDGERVRHRNPPPRLGDYDAADDD